MGDISIKGRSPILRQGYAVGGAVKGAKKFLDFIKKGKYVDKKGTKVNVPKAAERLTGKPHVDRVKKATGGWTLKKKLDFPGDRTGKPHSSREGRRGSWLRGAKRAVESAKKIREKTMKLKLTYDCKMFLNYLLEKFLLILKISKKCLVNLRKQQRCLPLWILKRIFKCSTQ